MGNMHALWIRPKDLGRLIFNFPRSRPVVAAEPDQGFRFASYLRISAWQIIQALALVGLTTIVYFAIDHLGLLNFVPVVYMIPVVIAATRWGLLPAIVASIAGFLASDYFFSPPYYSFVMEDPQEIVDLLLFLGVALVTSDLAARLKDEADNLRAREKELADLYAFSRRLAACFTVPELILAIEEYLSITLGRPAVVIAGAASGGTGPVDHQSLPEPIRQQAVAMIATGALSSRTIVEPATQRVWLITSISTDYVDHGAIVVDLGLGPSDAIDARRRHVEVVLAEAITRLKRLDLAKAMNDANLRVQADQFKEALVGGVSHDLRTPIASILGFMSVLAKFPEIRDDDRIHPLVEAAQTEAKQLDNVIQNLLNATRITQQGIHPQREWVDPADIVNAAIKQRSHRLAGHRLTVDIGRDLPLAKVHSTMIEQAFGQLLENAAKYSQTGSTIKVSARAEQDRVVLSVCDEGAGLSPEEAQQLFKRAFRSPRHAASVPGSGLGLWIANTFVTANGGTLEVASRGAGLGTTASIWLADVCSETSELPAIVHG
jgi:two-component system sensor histidine kinase KdpD